MIKVSIIVPIYNSESFLERCINSIVNQSYKNIEIILINDGSTDTSGKICEEFSLKDERIIVFHIENSGVSFARNLGIQKATGKYLLFIDSDDEVSTSYVSSFIKSKVNLNNSLIIQGCYVISKDKTLDYIYEDITYSKKKFSHFISTHEIFMHGGPIGKLYNRDIINKYNIKFNQNLHNYEDLMFFLDYIDYIDTIHLSSKTGYFYHIQPGGLHTTIHDYKTEEDILTLYSRKMLKYCSETNNIEFYKVKLLFNIIKAIYAKENAHKKMKVKEIQNKYPNIFRYSTKYLSKKEKVFFCLLKFRLYHICNVSYSILFKQELSQNKSI